MSWSGLAYCETCGQIVDVYSDDDGENFECGFCGKPIQFKFEDYVEKPELTYEQEDFMLLCSKREKLREKKND